MPARVELYESPTGHNPVLIFLESLDRKSRAKVTRMLDLLEEFGTALGPPHLTPVRGWPGLWELRARHLRNRYRILLCQPASDHFVLLHGFVKKRAVLPRSDLEMAGKRKEDYLRRKP